MEARSHGARYIGLEPKAYFANERTYLRWLTVSVLVVILSMGIFKLGKDTPDGQLNIYNGERIIGIENILSSTFTISSIFQ